SAPVAAASRVQALSRTAWYRSVLDSKCRYRMARLTPASAAMSSRLVAAKPLRAKARVAASMICCRLRVRGSRRPGSAASGMGLVPTLLCLLLHGTPICYLPDVHPRVYIWQLTKWGGGRGRTHHPGGRPGQDVPAG